MSNSRVKGLMLQTVRHRRSLCSEAAMSGFMDYVSGSAVSSAHVACISHHRWLCHVHRLRVITNVHSVAHTYRYGYTNRVARFILCVCVCLCVCVRTSKWPGKPTPEIHFCMKVFSNCHSAYLTLIFIWNTLFNWYPEGTHKSRGTKFRTVAINTREIQ